MEHQSKDKSWPATLVAPSRRPMLVCVVWYVAVLGIRFLPGVDRHLNLFLAFAFVSSIAATMAMISLGSGKVALLQLRPQRIVVGPHVLERATLRAELAVWKEPYAHTTTGSALCLQDAARSLRIGGRDRLLRGDETHGTVDHVDVSLSADDFDALLRALPLSKLQAHESKHAPVAVDLNPTTLSLRGWFQAVSPWLATIGVLGVIGLGAGALHFERNRVAPIVLQALMAVIVVTGLALSMRRHAKPPQARYRLLIEKRKVVLEDTRPGPGRRTKQGPPLRAERHYYRYSGRGGSFEYATVRLCWPSGRADVIGVLDTTWRWPDRAPRLRKLHYLVGRAEWQELIAALSLS